MMKSAAHTHTGHGKFLEDREFTKTVLFGLSAVGALLLVSLAVYANLVLK